MKSHRSLISKVLFGLWMCSSLNLQAAPPAVIAHQGRIIVAGINYNGTGYFKFSLVDASGTTTFWSNDGSAIDGSEPTNSVPVSVSKGLYTVPLGDPSFDGQMSSPIPAATFAANDDVRLRIWFSTDNVSFEQLSPDQRLLSSPYAISASQAQAVALGAISADMLSATAVQDSIEATGELGIGREGEPIEARLHLGSHPLLSEIRDGEGGFNELQLPVSVFVSDNVAYVASAIDDSLTIIDVSDPAAPVLISELKDGVGGFDNLNGARSVFVSGTTAYVAAETDQTLSIINISDPAAPVLLFEVNSSVSGFGSIGGAISVFVEGSVAYLSGYNGVDFIDVSNPAAPTFLGRVPGGDYVTALNVVGSYLYYGDFSNGWIRIVDVTNHAAPIVLSEFAQNFSQINSIKVQNGLLYAAARASNRVTIVDVQDPSNPVFLKELRDGQDGFNRLNGADTIVLDGTIAYVTALFDDALTVIDMSNPLQPHLLAEYVDGKQLNGLKGAGAAFLDGSNLYVLARGSGENALSIIDTTRLLNPDLVVSNRLGIGTTSPQAALHVNGDAYITGNILDFNRSRGGFNQYLSPVGSSIQWKDLPDESATNEIQSISFSGVLDTLSISGAGGVTPNPVDLGKFFNDDGSEPLDGNLVVSNSVTAASYNYPTAKSYTFKVPGNAMLPSTDNEDFFRSSIGYIRLDGTDTRFIATAPVQLPQGAVITGYDIMYLDNTSIANWTDFTTRLRRRLDTSSDAENIAALNIPSPAGINSTTVVIASDAPASFESSRATVDNNNYSYWVSLDCTVSAVDSNLRFLGFRIHYTLQELNP